MLRGDEGCERASKYIEDDEDDAEDDDEAEDEDVNAGQGFVRMSRCDNCSGKELRLRLDAEGRVGREERC